MLGKIMSQIGTRDVLALIVTMLFGVIVLLWMYHPPTLDQAQLPVLAGFVGLLGGALGSAFGFYFGTTKSREIDQTQANKSPDVSPTVPPAAIVFALAIGLSLFSGFSADAQTIPPRRPALTGNIVNDIKNAGQGANDQAVTNIGNALLKPFQEIATYIGDDIDGAIALATSTNIKDGHGQQCSIAMRDFGTIIKAHPVPVTLKVAQDIQALRLLTIAANRLCSNVHCTQVFADMSATITAVSPVPLLLPGMHDLCGKVPQIAVADPIDDSATKQ